MVRVDLLYKYNHPKALSYLGALEHAVILSFARQPRQQKVRGAISPSLAYSHSQQSFAFLSLNSASDNHMAEKELDVINH